MPATMMTILLNPLAIRIWQRLPEPKIINDINGVKVYNGGYGSSLVQDPQDKSVFYMLTDRGPNIDGPVKDSKYSPILISSTNWKIPIKRGKNWYRLVLFC